jgi:hypothetical protein
LYDDFDDFSDTKWTGTGTPVAGDGGLITLTGVLQTAIAGFTLPPTGNAPPATSTSCKKMFFLARLQFANVTGASFLAGFCATGQTLSSTVNGIALYLASGSMNLIIGANAAGSPSGAAFNYQIPLDPVYVNMSLINNQSFDVAISIDRNQNIKGWIGPQLVGWLPQSGTKGPFLPDGTPTTITPVVSAAVSNYNWMAQATGMAGNVATPTMFTTAPVAPTIAVSGTATVDFILAQKER